MSACTRCGAPVDDGAIFCSRCGLNLTGAGIALATTPPGAPLSAEPAATVLERLRAALAPRYVVAAEVGRGGMATVYRATRSDGTDVAIKVLLPELAATIGADRFQREIHVATELRHPHILGMLDAGTTPDGLLYYVMPFVTGQSLRAKLDFEGQLTIEEAVQVTKEVAAALGLAHERGFVHRDIKPENILLQDGHALVADFGIARALGEAETQKLTQTGMAVGTPVYMAPEQAVGEKVGPAADIYSLGCMLFEMLTGEPPFTGSNAVQILARHALELPRSVRVVRASVPEHVEQAIFAMLEKSAADRPRTAADVVALLDGRLTTTASLRTSMTQRALAGGAPAGAATPARRPVLLVGGAVAALALAAAGAWKAGLLGGGRSAAPLGPESTRVAVLYFADRSADQSLAPLADGLTEGLIDALGSTASLTVVSRSGVEKLRGGELPSDSAARLLRAGWIVRGSVEPQGRDVKVTLRLDDASGVDVATRTFVRPAAQGLALRDSLVVVAGELLRTQLGTALELKSQRAATADGDAWLLVQRGERRRRDGEAAIATGDTAAFVAAFAAADSLYLASAARDARWVTPRVHRALLAYRRARLAGRDLAAMRTWVDTGLARAQAALALAPRDADALELRGSLRYWAWLNALDPDPARQKARLDSARADLEAATRAAPRQAGAWATLSHLYNNVGTSAEVQLAAQRALEADEFLANADVVLGRLYLAAYDQAQFDKAGQFCVDLGRRFPGNALAMRCRLYQLTTRIERPDVGRAWRLADSSVALSPAPRRAALRLFVDQLVAAVLARAGRDTPALLDSARAVARRSEGDPAVDPSRDAQLVGAWVATLTGDRDDAFRRLQTYLAANPDRTAGLRDDPSWWFRDLVGDPRWKRLVGDLD